MENLGRKLQAPEHIPINCALMPPENESFPLFGSDINYQFVRRALELAREGIDIDPNDSCYVISEKLIESGYITYIVMHDSRPALTPKGLGAYNVLIELLNDINPPICSPFAASPFGI